MCIRDSTATVTRAPAHHRHRDTRPCPARALDPAPSQHGGARAAKPQDQNATGPKRRRTKTPQDQNATRPKRRRTKTPQDQ
eukprot:1220391-Prymnesium_polylepis.1